MVAEDIAIQVRQLSKSFGRRVVLDRVNLDVAPGECVVLTGANGAGKTTLLRCIGSVIRPTAGEVRWFGRRASGDPEARRSIGMVAHESRLYPNLSLRENLVFAARMCDVVSPRQRADELLEQVGLALHADRTPPVLSRGMQQRLAVARALVHNPPILLLDEPFAGLDADGANWLLEMLLDLRARGQTLCFALHDMTATRRLAHRVLQVKGGQLHEGSNESHDTTDAGRAATRAA